MSTVVFPNSSVRERWQRAVHLFYAGLFAFVLPFICWGAQATPGHPHARAHFVFAAPMLAAAVSSHAPETSTRHENLGHHQGNAMPAGNPQAAKAPPLPAGRSTPSLLGIAVLELIDLHTLSLPLPDEGPGFCCWLAPLNASALVAAIPTPPPR